MKKYIYCYYDKVQEAFTQPLFQDLDPVQMAEGLTRAIKKGFKVEQLSQFAGLQLFYLGEFDDCTGEFLLIAKKMLVECDLALEAREQVEASKKKEGEE